MQPQLLPPNVVPHWYAGGLALTAWRGIASVGDRSPEEWVERARRKPYDEVVREV